MKSTILILERTILLSVIIMIGINCQMCKNVPRGKHRVKTVIHYLKDNNPDSISFLRYNDGSSKILDKNKYLIDTTEYIYNTDEHVLHVIFSSNCSKYDYEYLNDRVIRRYYSPGNNISQVDTFILNSKGLIEKIVSNKPSTKVIMRKYNTDGYLKVNFFGQDDTVINEYHNGNEISSTTIDSGKITMTTTHTYYLDKENTIGDDNMGSGFWGLSSKNPIKNEYLTLAGVDPVMYNYTYKYDEKGRITSKAAYLYCYYNRLVDSTTYSYY